MAFKVKKSFQESAQQPIRMMVGTNAEEFVLGEILALSSGVLTKAGVDTDSAQQYVCMATVTGATGIANVPVVQLRKDLQFSVQSMATVAATLIGSAVTLHTDGLLVTATTTKGCFVIDETDGATTNSNVVGHFLSAAAV
jgi:hypothetical protein